MNRIKKYIYAKLILLFVTGNLFAQEATKLEGEFKVGPAIILILLLITFVMVGIFNRAKDTST